MESFTWVSFKLFTTALSSQSSHHHSQWSGSMGSSPMERFRTHQSETAKQLSLCCEKAPISDSRHWVLWMSCLKFLKTSCGPHRKGSKCPYEVAAIDCCIGPWAYKFVQLVADKQSMPCYQNNHRLCTVSKYYSLSRNHNGKAISWS